MAETVFDYVSCEEQSYRTAPISIVEGWEWNMFDHVNLTVLYKNSTYKTGKDDNKPFKNITRPLLNLQYRSEGFDVKDIILFIDDAYNYYKSFLVRKFHERWARENGIDTFIDEMVESYVDFGGALVKKINEKKPEVVPFQRLAFCDQTDILSGPLCEKHYYSPDQLRDMAKQGWQNIEEVITLAQATRDTYKTQNQNGKQSKTPGKYIEVYELHGTLPKWWLTGKEPGETIDYVPQLQIITFYKDQQSAKHGITLYSGKEKESPYKFIARDKIYGRALGLGGAEELFEPQVWTNYNEIRMKDMLDAASKVILKTTDTMVSARHPSGMRNMQNMEIVTLAANTDLSQVDTYPRNMALFEKSTQAWEAHGQQIAGASDANLGESPTAGTPFALQNLVIQQGQQLHEYRRGKLAVFTEEIYRDWIMPYIAKEITNGATFLSELDLEELQQIADSLVTCESNDVIVQKILSGDVIDPQEIEQLKQQTRELFMQDGNHKFVEILKDEMKDVPLEVQMSIKGKQKDLSAVVDKLSNIFRTIMANPAILQDPTMGKLFNQILESSGLEPLDFTSIKASSTKPAGATGTAAGTDASANTATSKWINHIQIPF